MLIDDLVGIVVVSYQYIGIYFLQSFNSSNIAHGLPLVFSQLLSWYTVQTTILQNTNKRENR